MSSTKDTKNEEKNVFLEDTCFLNLTELYYCACGIHLKFSMRLVKEAYDLVVERNKELQVSFSFQINPFFFLSCCVKTGENDRFQHKKWTKTQNFKTSKMDQKSI